MPELNNLVAQVTLRQWAVYLLTPAAEHISGNILLSVLTPTGALL